MPDPTYDLYLSYAPVDRAWATDWLLPRLCVAGLTVATEDDFAIGVPRLENIERAIAASRHNDHVKNDKCASSIWVRPHQEPSMTKPT